MAARVIYTDGNISRTFEAPELIKCVATLQTDLSASSLPVSTALITICSDDQIDYLLAYRQPIQIWFSNLLVGTFYVDDVRQTARKTYEVRAVDAVGVLDSSPYPGRASLSGELYSTLITDIVNGQFYITKDSGTTDAILYGLIAPQSRRDALCQVLFARGAYCVTTDGWAGIRIRDPDLSSGDIVPPDIVANSARIDTSAAVTAAAVTQKTYEQSADGSITISGVTYKESTGDTFIKAATGFPEGTKDNIKQVNSCSLLANVQGAQRTLEHLFAYSQRRDVVKARMLWDGERLGDTLVLPYAWGRTMAVIEKMTITLSGIAVADVEARGISAVIPNLASQYTNHIMSGGFAI